MSAREAKQRVAFLLRLRPGMGEAYDRSHEHVWPEMLDLLKRSGVSEYSIFRRDEMLVLVMCVEDFDTVWDRIEADPINTRWQQAMAPYFEPIGDLRPGERFPMLREVFYLP
ncbi:L-rhamnose mutarotase [Acidicapsa acidisoli]|uniref:L-rhamnose mutarotase n=1 Tax=Acidicapsa acidisoli TaxID=1615681 RepID=UPI0021E05784|nr:L-rhamnose mutarotase [Acidicapsa acidisoli]